MNKNKTTTNERQQMKTINCEPNWQDIFDFAVRIVKTNLPKDQGRETVVEMLEFGKRSQAQLERILKNDETQKVS